MITRRVAVVKGLIADPVSERVNAESSLLDEADSQNTSIDITADPVAPAEPTDKSWEHETHSHDTLEVIAMLPDDDWIFVEVGDVGATDALRVLLHDQPADVGV